MAEFGVAATMEVDVDSQSLSAARAEIEQELGGVTVSPEMDQSPGGATSGSALPMTDGGASVGEQLAEQTELLEDIEEQIGGQGGGGGGGMLLAGGAGALAPLAAAIGGAAAGGALQFGAEELASELSPALEEVITGRREDMTQSTDASDPSQFATDTGERIAANFMRAIDPVGIGEAIGRGTVTRLKTFDGSQIGADIAAEIEGIDENSIGVNMANAWGETVDSRVDSIFDGSVGSSIGTNMAMALDPLGIGETFARSARAELSSVFDGILGGGDRPTDAQTIMENNEGALTASDRNLAEAAASENRARQQRQNRMKLDVNLSDFGVDISGLDELDQWADNIANRVERRLREELTGL